ncbi:MAG: Flp family type IVb pilin [Sphingobium sp.]|nr:Flp family type IVb pilin [Sphingobium sp.]
MQFFRKLIKDNKGATAIEYGLIAALIAVAAIGAMTAVGGEVTNTFNKVDTTLKNANGGSSTSSTSTDG